MKKRLLFFTFLLIILTSLVLISSNLQKKDAISVKDFHRNEQEIKNKTKIIGEIANISSESLTIRDLDFPENEKVFQIQEKINLSSFSLGQTVLITGDHEIATNVEAMDRSEALRYLELQKPLLEITILEYEKEIENICQDINFKINIKNISNKDIRYQDIYDEAFGYSIAYIINETPHLYFQIDDFGVLQPRKNKDIRFKTEESLKETMLVDENSIQFAWIQKSLYDEEIKALNASEKVKLAVKDINCE